MKEVLLSSCASFVWTYVLGMSRFKYKPFNCETCMAGWFCLLLCIIGKYAWYMIPFYMAASMCCTIVLTAYLKKV